MLNKLDSSKKTYNKGLGWIPDIPDERDYDLYDEIYEKYKKLKEQKNPLVVLTEVLQKTVEKTDLENKERIKSTLKSVERELDKFDFLGARAHKVLRLGDSDRRVLHIKSYLAYFYKTLIETQKKAGNQPGLSEEERREAAKVAIKEITHSLVETLADALEKENGSSLDNFFELMKAKDMHSYDIQLPKYECNEELYSDDECDSNESVVGSDEGAKQRIENILNKLSNKSESNIRIEETASYHPLIFLDTHHKFSKWINDSEFCFITEALVKGFQGWARFLNRNGGSNPGINYNKNKDMPCEGIKPDGVIGINTYAEVTEWIFSPSNEHRENGTSEDQSRRENISYKVPFPTSIPPKILEIILDALQSKIGVPEDQDKIDFYRTRSQDVEGMKLVSQENFFEIEPIISTVLQILGPLGSYPKTLESSLKFSVEIFCLLLEKKNGRVHDLSWKDMSWKSIESFPKNEHLIKLAYQNEQDFGDEESNLLAIGSSKKLPDTYFLDLKDDAKTLIRLKYLANKSIKVCSQRIASYLEMHDINELHDINLMSHQSATNFPLTGKNLVVVAKNPDSYPDSYHVRIFDRNGDMVVNQEIEDPTLINDLDEVPAESAIDEQTGRKLIRNITSNVGLTPYLRKATSSASADSGETSADPDENRMAILQKISTLLDKLLDDLNLDGLKEKYEKLKDSDNDDLLSPSEKFDGSIILEFLNDENDDDKGAQAEQTNNGNPRSLTKSDSDVKKLFLSKFLVPSGEELLQNRRKIKGIYSGLQNTTTREFTLLPKIVDLSVWCSPITDQGALQSCSAQAAAGLFEYFSQRYTGKRHKPVSRRFLYKVARNLKGLHGDVGVSLRAMLKAMVLFGSPPEDYWCYEHRDFDEEPSPFCYSFAQNYQAVSYFRLDSPNIDNEDLLIRVKIALAAGFPCMFGFTTHESVHDEFNIKRGYIPYPGKVEDSLFHEDLGRSLSRPDGPIGGHAVVAVGYHDHKVIRHSNNYKKVSEGALLIRNSWGLDWGLSGYGWLPYDYVLEGQTSDWWSLLKAEWLESGKFGLGGNKDTGTSGTGKKGQK